MDGSRRYVLLKTLMTLEAAAAIAAVIAASAGGSFIFASVMLTVLLWVYGAGFLVAIVGSIAKPRQRLALVSLVLHALIGLCLLLAPSIQSWSQARTDAKLDQLRADSRRARTLVSQKQVDAALDFLKDHPEVENEALASAAACPQDRSAPSEKLIRFLLARDAHTRFTAEGVACSRKAVEALLALHLPVESFDVNSLEYATDPEVLLLLIAHGADVNKANSLGASPLMSHRSAAVTKLLLARGANIKAVDANGRTVLHMEHSRCGDENELAPIFELLIAAGAEPNARSSLPCGDTPLLSLRRAHWNQDAARVLTIHGADPLAKNCSGVSAALDFVAQSKDGGGDAGLQMLRSWSGIDFAGKDGSALLIEAASQVDTLNLAARLLAYGANPEVPDREGTRPIDFVRTMAGDAWRDLREAIAARAAQPDAASAGTLER